ncbi:MAG: hypothetical protein ACRD1B_04345 [Thermoanaerobaculia bacterium]
MSLVLAALRLSEESFRKAWDNADDSVYDALEAPGHRNQLCRIQPDRPDFIIMAVTSQAPSAARSPNFIQGWKQTGLPKPSSIKSVLATVA